MPQTVKANTTKPFMGPKLEDAGPVPVQAIGFDVEAARRDGVDDDSILNHLVSTRNFDVAGALRDGASKQDIIQYLSSTPAPTPGKFAPGGAAGKTSGATGSFQKLTDRPIREQAQEHYRALDRKVGQTINAAVPAAFEQLGELDTNPIGGLYHIGKGIVTGTARGIYNAPSHIEDIYYGLKEGNPEMFASGATGLASESVPAALGVKAGVGAAIDIGTDAAASMAASKALKARNSAIENLSSAIQSGIKSGAGADAAEIYQPYIQSFLKKAGVRTEEILPKFGDSATLRRGGSYEVLSRLNKALKDDWIASGKDAAKFIPHTDVHMALADGAVNEAHAPIANAVRAVRDVKIDGSEVGVSNIQGDIIQELTRKKAALSPSQHLELDHNFDAAIADVRKAKTIGELDNVRRDWNQGMTRFHSGNPTAITNADASSAAVWNVGNNIIREKLYPTLEQLTDRPGAVSGLAEAGRREAVAIQARDGIYMERVKASNMADNVNIQNYFNYVKEGPHTVVSAVRSPVTTGLSFGSRILGKQRPMGEFNAALRKGIGDISDFRPMDASAFPKRQITTGVDTSGPIPLRPGQIQGRIAAPAPPPDPSGIAPIRAEQIVRGERPLLPSGPPVLPDTNHVDAAPIPGNPGYVPAPRLGPSAVTGTPARSQSRPPVNQFGVEIEPQEGYTPTQPAGADLGHLGAQEPTPPPTGLPAGKGQAKTSGVPPSSKTASEHLAPSATTEEGAPQKAPSGLPEGSGEQAGKPVPKNKDYPESAKDYFSILEEEADGEAVGEVAAAAKQEAKAKPAAKKQAPPAAEKKAAPAKPKAEAKKPTPPKAEAKPVEAKAEPTAAPAEAQKAAEAPKAKAPTPPKRQPRPAETQKSNMAEGSPMYSDYYEYIQEKVKRDIAAGIEPPKEASQLYQDLYKYHKGGALPEAAPAPKAETPAAEAPKAKATAKKPTPPPKAQAAAAPAQTTSGMAFEKIRKKGALTSDDMVNLGDSSAANVLDMIEERTIKPTDSDAITLAYLHGLNEEFPADIIDFIKRKTGQK